MARVNSTNKVTGNSFNVANATGSQVRGAMNNVYDALRTLNSDSGDPSGDANVVQYQPHIDTSSNLLKICTAVNSGTGTFTRGNKVKSIMSGKSGDFAGTFNGEAVQTDTSGSFFGPGTTGVMSIGRYGPSTGYELEGHIQRITYWPKQLTDTQLKTLTS